MLKAPLNLRLADDATDRVRRNHEDRILELQKLPAASLKVIPAVSLADGVTTPVAHGLGRAPTWCQASIPRGAASAGYLVEIRDGSVDRAKYVALQANGYGATVTVDVAVI